ncbi:MAG: hypothetical protein K1X67_05515 [Fimbriimonadaceae bacterium]|nr:hypothetical protein [Fimbriimonadaceae bacterium]
MTSNRLLIAAGVILQLGLARASEAQSLLQLQASTPGSAQSGNVNITGVWIAGQFVGLGSGLTGVPVYLLVGTFPDSMFDASVCRLGSNDTITGIKTFVGQPGFNTTTPFTVSSTGKVINLKVDKLDGLDSTQFFNPTSYTGTFNSSLMSSNVLLLSGAQTVAGQKTFSAQASFTAATPMTVVGSGLVANLNVDRLDGLDSSQFVHDGQPFTLDLSAPNDRLVSAVNTSVSDKTVGVVGTATTGAGIGVRGVGEVAPDLSDPTVGWAGAFTGGLGAYASRATIGSVQSSDPNAPLTIHPNSTGGAIRLHGPDSLYRISASAGNYNGFDRRFLLLGVPTGADMAFGYGSGASMVTKFMLKGNGNFGIGTTTPNYKVHVNGAMTVTKLKWFGNVALGDDAGNVSSGTVGESRLAKDPDSFEKVTGGQFFISNAGDVNSSSRASIKFAWDAQDLGYSRSLLDAGTSTTSGSLKLRAYDPFYVEMVQLTAEATRPNDGSVSIWGDPGGLPATQVPFARMFVNANGDGVISATGLKNFRVPDPDDFTRDLFYACIEGPEAAMYARGTGRLVNGEAHIEFPDHFRKLAAEQGITVILQPRGRKSRGLGVENTSPDGCTVFELKGGQGDYEFDWEVKAVRKGYEDYRPVRLRNEN